MAEAIRTCSGAPRFVDKILRGAKPGEQPGRQTTKFESRHHCDPRGGGPGTTDTHFRSTRKQTLRAGLNGAFRAERSSEPLIER